LTFGAARISLSQLNFSRLLRMNVASCLTCITWNMSFCTAEAAYLNCRLECFRKHHNMTFYYTGSESYLQRLHFCMKFYSRQRKVKNSEWNRRGAVPVWAIFFLLSVTLYLIGRWWFFLHVLALYYKSSKILTEVTLRVELVWICNARWFWVWLVESVWAVLQNAPRAHAWLDVFLTSSQEHRKISFWSRPAVVNWVRIETGFKSQAQIRALVQISSRLLENTIITHN